MNSSAAMGVLISGILRSFKIQQYPPIAARMSQKKELQRYQRLLTLNVTGKSQAKAGIGMYL
jgi:hypothetical protein